MAYLHATPRLRLEGRPHIHKTATFIFTSLLLLNLLTLLTGQFDRLGLTLNVFLASLVACIAAVNSRPLRGLVAEQINAFAGFLNRRGAFRSDPEAEMPKFALIRIAFGALMLERGIWILLYLEPSDWRTAAIWAVAVANMLAALCVCVGLATQLSLAYLVLFQWQAGDLSLGTSTLGNDIAAMLSLLLLFANAGTSFSLDSILRKRPGRIGRLASSLYYEFGVPPTNTLQIVKFITLGAYWCVCLYSLSMHLGEPSWTNGTVGPLLLSSTFLSRYAGEFTHFFQLGPWEVLIGRAAIWAMLPWYVFLLPFVVIGGFFRTYVIVWGILFFTLSVFVLQLGWLGQFEFLLFAGLFWQRRFITTDRLRVAYDDRCNLCDRTVQFIKAVDLFRRVELRPLSSNVDWLIFHGIDPRDALTDLYGLEDSANAKPRHGYDFYLLLSGHVLLLLPFYPVLYIGRFIGGPAIYRFVADRRTRIFGVCEIPLPKAQHRLLPLDKIAPFLTGEGDPVGYFSVHMAVLCLFYLLALPAPYLGWPGISYTGGIPNVISAFARAANVYGVTPINVFNVWDLRSTENWFTISAVGSNGTKTLLPIFAEDGSRLAMHKSDRVYFGHTLIFRRSMIGRTGCAFDTYKALLRYLVEKTQSAAPTSSFIYHQYFQPLPETAGLLAGSFATVPARQVCEVQF